MPIADHGEYELLRVAQAARALKIHIDSDGDYRLTSQTFNHGSEAKKLLDDLQSALDALDEITRMLK